MKRVIITPEQLKAINEAAALTYAKSSNPADITAAVNGMIGKTTSNEFQVKIPGNDGPALATTLPALEKGKENINQNASVVNVTADPTKTGMSESRYTKRQVELGRILEMRKNGKVFSKKQLNEMFMESDDIAEKIKNRPAFDVMTSFGCVFGRDAEREMMDMFSAGKNPTDFIVSVYNDASPEDQELFRKKIGI